jgi:uncharacterized protein YbjT (DUF2867 family)
MRQVLVTGATGTVGRHVVRGLVEESDDEGNPDVTDPGEAVTVKAGVRDVERAQEDLPDGAEFVEFDFERPETWGAAFADVDAMFLIRPPSVGRVSRHVTPAVDAAARVGVEHVVYLSVLGAEKNPLLPHRRIERHLESAAVTYTFLRASFFMQNFLEVHRADIVERDEIFLPAGDGATSFVDARDVAAVAVAVLTEHGHENCAYDLTGPAALGYDETAAVFSDALGRRIEYADPGLVEFARRALDRGEPLPFVLVQAAIYTTARLGLAGRLTDEVDRVLGRPPRSLATFVEDCAEEFEADKGG